MGSALGIPGQLPAFTGVYSNGDGQLTDHPIIVGVPLLRNSFRQPNEFLQGLRIAKTFHLVRESTLEWGVELFNVWNTKNYNPAAHIRK